jgi:hypothetical protein
MSLRPITNLIEQARIAASELDNTDTTGVSDIEIVRYLNQGQNIIYRKIISKSQKLFSKTVEIPIAASQKLVDMPKDIYAQNRITDVKYVESEYIYQIHAGTEKDDLWNRPAIPVRYFRRNNQIVLVPQPLQAGTIRLSYIYKIPELNKKAGTIADVTTSSNTITLLEADIVTDTLDTLELLKFTRFSVVDKEGNVKMSNIKYDSANPTTGVITITPGFTFDTATESIAVGDTIVAGPYSSTFSALEADVEEYVVEYAILKLLQKQNSSEVVAQAELLRALEDDIMNIHNKIDDDIKSMSLTNDDSNDFDW